MNIFDRFRLDGRRLFVTGGSRGLGREMALAIAGAGADVVISGRDQASLEKTTEDIERLGRNAWSIQADIGDPAQCEDACKKAISRYGAIGILINNVGGRRVNIPTEEMPLDTWHQMLDLNLTGTFLCTKIIGGEMVRRGKGGRIINISSINSMVSNRGIAGRHGARRSPGALGAGHLARRPLPVGQRRPADPHRQGAGLRPGAG